MSTHAAAPARTDAGPPPGPRAPQPVQFLRFLRDPVAFLRDCEARYGQVFTIKMLGTPGYVMVSGPQLAQQVFATDRDIGRAGAARGEFLEPLVGSSSLLTLDGEAWTRQRKMLGSAFHGKRIEPYREQIAAIAAEHVDGWPIGTPLRLHARFQSITLEVILRVIFGVSDAGSVRRLMGLLPRLLSATESTEVLSFLLPPAVWRRLDSLLVRVPGTANARFVALRRATDRIIHDEIDQRRRDADFSGRDDILSVLMAAEDAEGNRLTDAELRDALMTLLLAGHETTATALAWCVERLIHHPEVHARSRAAAHDGDDAYLGAVAKETLRTRPVVPDMPRVVSQPTTLGGYRIPAGWWITPSPLLLHESPGLYGAPREFRPERFLDDTDTDLDPHAWIPFGGGRRRCLGAQFALMEMGAVLPEVLTRVRLRPARPAAPERPSARHVTLAPAHGARVVAERA